MVEVSECYWNTCIEIKNRAVKVSNFIRIIIYSCHSGLQQTIISGAERFILSSVLEWDIADVCRYIIEVMICRHIIYVGVGKL